MVLTKLKSMTLEQTDKAVSATQFSFCKDGKWNVFVSSKTVNPWKVNAVNFLFQLVAELQSFKFDFFFVTFTSKN